MNKRRRKKSKRGVQKMRSHQYNWLTNEELHLIFGGKEYTPFQHTYEKICKKKEAN